MRTAIRKTSLILCILLLLLIIPGCGGTVSEPSEPAPELTCIAYDAGKADAFLLYTPESSVLIDCGKKSFGETLSEEVSALTDSHVDALILSHFDKDHVGGAEAVLKNCEVDKVYTTYLSKSSKHIDAFYQAMEERGLKETEVREKTSFTLDGVLYEILPPHKENYASSDSNNSSLVVRVSAGDKVLLFTGDIEEERSFELLGSENIKCDVYKVPHHGQHDPASEALIKATGADIALITSSDKEPEDEELIKSLKRFHVRTYLTREGSVVLNVKDDRIIVDQE